MNKARKSPAASCTRSVEVAVEGVPAPSWRGRLRPFCQRVMREVKASQWELSVLLCDDKRMKELNQRYRGKDSTNDVLSFPGKARRAPGAGALEGAEVSGDIAISVAMLQSNARRFGVTDEEELKRLLIHGILHCAGMDHGTGKGRGMLALQQRLLDTLKEVRIIGK